MALSVNAVWEVRPTVGSDNNGGAFVAGASGTDYSQQDTAQLSNTDLAIDGVDNTKVSSAGSSFTSAHVGNHINVTAGTNFTVGIYQVVSVAAGVATCDRAVGTVGATGGTFKLGGALATLAKVLANGNRPGNKIFIKATGTLTTNATHTLNNGVTPARNAPPNQIIGYGTTRGDSGRATIQLITNTGLTALSDTVGGWYFKNLIIDCNSLGTSTGIRAYVFGLVYNCKISNFRSYGINANGNTQAVIIGNEINAGQGTAGIDAGNNSFLFGNWVHDNTCHGISVGGVGAIEHNIVSNNTGVSTDGIQFVSSQNFRCIGNTCYGNGRHGINYGQPYIAAGTVILNNILVSNGAWGINGGDSVGSEAEPQYDGNAFYNNTSGTRQFMDEAGATVPVHGASPYTNVRDKILTADPFTNAAGNDFTLNNNAGGGAVCRAAGYPGSLPLTSGLTGYLDMGPLQHQEVASGGLKTHPGLSGGLRG